jgi:4-hydroxy-3-polyprenylbenzoate decarboxylase
VDALSPLLDAGTGRQATGSAGIELLSGVDATNKWPPETRREWGTKIRMTDEIIERVTARWSEYGLPGSGKPIWRGD